MRSFVAILALLCTIHSHGQIWPIRIEAERYDTMQGITTEDCMEGGLNITGISVGDWADYKINIPASGYYFMKIRAAGNGGIIQVRDSANNILGRIRVPSTGNHQVFRSGASRIRFMAGYRTYRLYFQTDIFNVKSIEVDTTNYRHFMTFSPITPFTGSTTWENTLDVGGWIKEINNARPGAATIVENPFGRIGYAVKFEQRKTDTPAAVRAEMRLSTVVGEPREVWIGWSEYLPTEDWGTPDAHQAVVGQWHEQPDFHLGENWRSPPIMRKIQNGRNYINIMWDADPVNTNATKDGEVTIDLGPIDTNIWTDWVFHIKYGYDNTGILEVWVNNLRLVKRINMPNSFNDVAVPYFKIGVYEGAWCCEPWVSQSPGTKRTVYIMNLKIGKPNSSKNECKPW